MPSLSLTKCAAWKFPYMQEESISAMNQFQGGINSRAKSVPPEEPMPRNRPPVANKKYNLRDFWTDILKDDVHGFSSTSDICFMVLSYRITVLL